MKTFSFQDELQKIIDGKELTAVRFYVTPEEFKVAFVLHSDQEFTTLAEINELGEFDGVCMYRTEIICSWSTDTPYLNKLKKILNPSALDQAVKDISPVKEFTFHGFVAAFENTNTLVEVAYKGNFKPAGKIIGHDEHALALVEIDENYTDPIAHSLIHFASVVRLSIDIPYMRETAAAFQKEKLD